MVVRRHMLAVALVCELHKADWKELLVVDGHVPHPKLESVVHEVQEADMKSFLYELVERARPPTPTQPP
jgi:hypothetical protein